MKKIFLTFLFLFLSISIVSAFEFDNVLTTRDNNQKYPTLVIENAFGLGDDIAKLELLENTEQCLINCYAVINLTLYENSKIMDEFDFVDKRGRQKILDYNVYYEIIDKKDIIINDYDTVCYPYELDTKGNISIIQNCTEIIIGNHQKEVITYDWKKYNLEELPAGNYKIKIESKKDEPNIKIDWSFSILGITKEQIRDYWAWWDASWTKKRQINITGGLVNSSILLNISYDADMDANFQDLRFVTDEATPQELGYWFYDNGVSASTSADIWVKTEGNTTIYMYYGNGGATNNSDITEALNFGEDWNSGIDWTSKWMSTDQSHYSVANGILSMTVVNPSFGQGIYINGSLPATFYLQAKVSTSSITDDTYYLPSEDTPGTFDGTETARIGTASTYFKIDINGGATSQTGGIVVADTFYRLEWKNTGAAYVGNWSNLNNGTSLVYASAAAGEYTGYWAMVHLTGTGVGKNDWLFYTPLQSLNSTFIMGDEETALTDFLTASLSYPSNNIYLDNGLIGLGCNFSSSGINITDVIVKVYDSADNLDYSDTDTGLLTYSYNATWTTTNLDDDVYTWLCIGYGELGINGTSSNRSFTIDTVMPSIVINHPLTEIQTFITPINTTLNATVTDDNLQSCWYYNTTANVSITCNSNATIPLPEGYATLIYYANDTAGNTASNSTTFLVNYIKYLINFSSSKVEGEPDTVYFNITATNITTVTANLTHDSIIYPLNNNFTNATLAILSRNVTSPTVLVDTYINMSVNFTINGFNYETTNYSQLIYNLQNITVSTNCTGKAVAFTLKDEENQTLLNGIFHYNILYGLSYNNTLNREYGEISNVNFFYICVNSTVSDDWEISQGEIAYTTEGYVDRRYYFFEGSTITNVTQNITLYDLLTASQTSFKLEVEDTSLNPYTEKYTSLLRWYPSLNQYNVVDMGLTDENGETVIHTRAEDADYRIGVYEKNGTLIKLSDPTRMICLVDPCTYTFRISPIDQDFTSFFDVTYTFNYNSTTGIWTFIYTDTSELTSTMNLTVYKDTGTSSYAVCSDIAAGYTNVLTCNTSAYSGNLRGEVYRSASPNVVIAQKLINTISTAFTSTFGLYISLILGIPIVFLFSIVSPIAAIIGGVISLVPALILGTINWAILGGIAVLAGIVSHFLKRVG